MTVHELIALAIQEDLPSGDITTDNLQLKEKSGHAFLIAKSDLKLSGKEFFTETMLTISATADLKWYFNDGDTVFKTQKVASIYGNLLEVIKAERVALNFLGFFSGIATLTNQFVSARAPNSKLQILDTRKTLSPYRPWIKQAVVDGGGMNHRQNLSDAVLIKENHIRIAGGITQAVQQIRKHTKGFVEVEVTSLAEIQEAVQLDVQRLLLDNMSDEMIQQAVAIIPDAIETEASGNMTIARIKSLSQIEGLDFVSVGALTHSAPCADLSLLFEL
jgi:nicotinate-nucleotide pyrophosphorylase (carboxylating)